MKAGGPRVAALGGGHGLSATLLAARRYAGAVTAVVSVADDGGSSGRLRELAGIPAPGDLRRCLVALGDPASVWCQVFEHRFSEGELAGHAVGNLVVAALAEVLGDFPAAISAAATLVGAEGRVLAATDGPVDLVAEVAGGQVVGQVKVAECGQEIRLLSLVPPDARAPRAAVDAIVEADQVLLGPGSMFTSVLAAAVVPDIRTAIAGRRAGRVLVANLRAEEPEAGGRGPLEQLRVLARHGIVVDTMVYDPGPLPASTGASPPGAGPADRGGSVRRELPPTVDGIRCVPACMTDGHGAGHDSARLAGVLESLA